MAGYCAANEVSGQAFQFECYRGSVMGESLCSVATPEA